MLLREKETRQVNIDWKKIAAHTSTTTRGKLLANNDHYMRKKESACKKWNIKKIRKEEIIYKLVYSCQM